MKENPIFVQKRALSLNHPKFKIYKLRTMATSKVPDVNSVFVKDKNLYDVKGFRLWLRKTGIDEMPQLINIIKGDMNLIGPRPFTIPDLEILKKHDLELYLKREAIKSKPGITGYWQVFGNRKEGLKNVIEFDKYFDMNKNLKLKYKIFIRTLKILFFAKHTDSLLSFSSADNQIEEIEKLSGTTV